MIKLVVCMPSKGWIGQATNSFANIHCGRNPASGMVPRARPSSIANVPREDSPSWTWKLFWIKISLRAQRLQNTSNNNEGNSINSNKNHKQLPQGAATTQRQQRGQQRANHDVDDNNDRQYSTAPFPHRVVQFPPWQAHHALAVGSSGLNVVKPKNLGRKLVWVSDMSSTDNIFVRFGSCLLLINVMMFGAANTEGKQVHGQTWQILTKKIESRQHVDINYQTKWINVHPEKEVL